jgi:hypothetical protein
MKAAAGFPEKARDIRFVSAIPALPKGERDLACQPPMPACRSANYVLSTS